MCPTQEAFGSCEKNVIVTMELEVPKKLIFKPTLSTVMVQQGNERGKRGSLATNVRGPWQKKLCFFQTLPQLQGKNGRRRGEGQR